MTYLYFAGCVYNLGFVLGFSGASHLMPLTLMS